MGKDTEKSSKFEEFLQRKKTQDQEMEEKERKSSSPEEAKKHELMEKESSEKTQQKNSINFNGKEFDLKLFETCYEETYNENEGKHSQLFEIYTEIYDFNKLNKIPKLHSQEYVEKFQKNVE